MKITKRRLQITLGILWLIDGALQLQHQMFSASFANNVIFPTAQGQPTAVSGPIHFGVHIILLHPSVFDALFALIQISIGALILYKPTIKYGLRGSVVWGLLVWYFGEGLAGMASGHASILMGAPGAALLYAIMALAAFPHKDYVNKRDGGGSQPAYWLGIVWAALWTMGAIFQLLPGQNSVTDLSSMISGNVSGAPGWLASIDTHVASVINGFGTPTTSMTGIHMTMCQMAQMPTQPGSGYWFILLLALVQLCIGIGIFFRGNGRKIAIVAGIILSIVFWVVGQNLGGYYTGLATDPNSAPLFILLGIAIFDSTGLDSRLPIIYKKVEYVLTGKPNKISS